jgi:hypothetical protein
MALFTLSISNLSPAFDKQHQEVANIHHYLNLAAQDVRGAGGKRVSGNILDGATVVGSWAYTPQAAS